MLAKRGAQANVRFGEAGLDLQRLLEMSHGVVHFSPLQENVPEVDVGRRIFRIDLQGLLEM